MLPQATVLVLLWFAVDAEGADKAIFCSGVQYNVHSSKTLECNSPDGKKWVPVSDTTLDGCASQFCTALTVYSYCAASTVMIHKAFDGTCAVMPIDVSYVAEVICEMEGNGGGDSGSSGGLTWGGIALIVFGVSTFVYFAGGIAYNIKVRGMEGRDVIPNVAFWADLPLLVKDGVMFLVRKAQGGGSSEYKSTDINR